MGKALMVSRDQSGTALISGDDLNLFGAQTRQATESSATASATEACTFSNLRGNIFSGGSGTNNFQFRKNTANGNQLGTRSGPGAFEDTTNTDVLATNDTFAVAYTDTGTDSLHWIAGNVQFSSGHGNFHGSGGFNTVFDVDSSTSFCGLAGSINSDGNANEDEVQWKNRAYTSWEALQVRVAANARTSTSTFKNRIGSSDGGFQIDFGAGVTGLVVDTSTPDTLVDGDLLSVSVTLGSGATEDLTVSLILGTFKSTSNKSDTWCGSQSTRTRTASSTAHYLTIGGGIAAIGGGASPSEANARIKVGFAARVSNLRCYLSENTYTGDATLKLYQGGSAVITLTLTAGVVGWFENSSDTVTISATDELSLELDEGTSGSITIRTAGITFSSIDGNISSAGESVATLTGASIAEAPISSAGESIATFVGTSANAVEGAISFVAESIATLSGAATASADTFSGGEAIATMGSASLANGAISMAGESLLTVVGTGISGGDDTPAWFHGTSKKALKNPWGRKKRIGPDDDEVWTLLSYAISVTKKSTLPH